MHTATPWMAAVIEPKTASLGPARATLMGPPIINYERGQYFTPQDASFIVKAVNAHEEAIELLTAVTQSDGKVSDLLFNQIQAALKKWGES